MQVHPFKMNEITTRQGYGGTCQETIVMTVETTIRIGKGDCPSRLSDTCSSDDSNQLDAAELYSYASRKRVFRPSPTDENRLIRMEFKKGRYKKKPSSWTSVELKGGRGLQVGCAMARFR